MDFTNTLANNKEALQDKDFYYEEGSVEECELFKHVYEVNEILSIEEEISLETFNEEGITLDVIPSLRFIDETLRL